MRFYTLLGNRLCDSLAVSALELTSEKVAEPSLQQWDDTAQEEKPDPPTRSPEADTRTLAYRPSVETSLYRGV
jgi:hypothetical protein